MSSDIEELLASECEYCGEIGLACTCEEADFETPQLRSTLQRRDWVNEARAPASLKSIHLLKGTKT